ncbi:tetratricopeptide repeat domain protein [Microscilla marina ATCC 23134]|uniref:Tetratricopeptide repeat domain protein n=2 Tax=Microscilla marina TaxID=1027 RepID=A1ZZR4_MICM2|nr:tetratricopeptide repeat domain protein [Microscilla marina ATCC 23134]
MFMKKLVFNLMLLSIAFGQVFNVHAQNQAQQAKKVLNTLAYYFGNDGIIPELKVRKKLNQPALYTNYQKPQILLDEQMFQISRSFGKDSTVVLAFVLGHEMAHHYLKHSPGDANDIKTHEKDADKWGCFYAHVAGYKVSPELYARLLDKIYEVYKLHENIAHYPAKDARKKLGLQKVKEIQDFNLGEVFNSAKFLYAIGKLGKSIECLEFIFNKHFKSAEMCNNLAVSYLSTIAQVKPLYQRIFLFPFEFDGSTSLRSEQPKVNLPQLFEKSELLLRQALSIRKNYHTARLNLACLQIMQRKFGSATDNLLELANEAGKLPPQAHSLLALVYAYRDNHPKATQHFKAAIAASNNYIARCNYAIYKKLVPQAKDRFSARLKAMKEYEVADLIEEVKKEALHATPNTAGFRPQTQAFAHITQLKTSKTVVAMRPYFEVRPAQKALPSGYHYIKIKTEEANLSEDQQNEMLVYEVCFTPGNNHQLNLLGVKVGDPVKKLTAVLGKPSQLPGNFYIYKNRNIIIETKKNNIIGWMIYRKVE